MPRWARESAVMFSRKWILAFGMELVFNFSTIATEVSSLQARFVLAGFKVDSQGDSTGLRRGCP